MIMQTEKICDLIVDKIELIHEMQSDLDQDRDALSMLVLIAQELAYQKLISDILLKDNVDLKRQLKEGD